MIKRNMCVCFISLFLLSSCFNVKISTLDARVILKYRFKKLSQIVYINRNNSSSKEIYDVSNVEKIEGVKLRLYYANKIENTFIEFKYDDKYRIYASQLISEWSNHREYIYYGNIYISDSLKPFYCYKYVESPYRGEIYETWDCTSYFLFYDIIDNELKTRKKFFKPGSAFPYYEFEGSNRDNFNKFFLIFQQNFKYELK